MPALIPMPLRLSTILFSVIILFTSCKSHQQNNKLIEGDLYYSWFRIGSFYNQPDSIIEKVKVYADTVNRKLLDSNDLRFLKMYETLKAQNLLYNPYIELKLDNDSIIKVYFTINDYEKIKIYRRQELIDTKKKIRIKAEVKDLGKGMALSTNLISINKVDGETLQINKKFKIEDYQ